MLYRKVSKRNKILSILVGIVFSSFFIFIFPLLKKDKIHEIEAFFRKFYKSNISNIIIYVKSKGKGQTEFITKDNNYYLCLITSKDGGAFHDCAEKGDSIYKPAYSETLYLYKSIKIPFKDKRYKDVIMFHVDPKYHCVE